MSHVHYQRPSLGRIASMQDLYIGRACTTDRTSSRAYIATAAASPPSSPANGATASCLKQTNGSTLESRWLNGWTRSLSKRQLQKPKDKESKMDTHGNARIWTSIVARCQKGTRLTEVGVPSLAGRSLEVSESSCSFKVFKRF